MLETCPFGSVKYLAFLDKNLRPNMVLNRVEAEVPQRRLTPTSILNFGVNMVIGLHSIAKIKRYMKKDGKALHSVSMAAMNVSSSTPLDVDKDIVLDA